MTWGRRARAAIQSSRSLGLDEYVVVTWYVCLDIHCLFNVFFLLYHSVDSVSGEFYYFNFATGETQWEHPLDEVYRQKVRLTDISVVIISLFSVHPTHSDMAF